MEIKDVLKMYKKGEINEEEAEKLIKIFSYSKLGDVIIDISRRKRIKIPEIIYGYKKRKEDILNSILNIMKFENICFVSRINPKKYLFIKKNLTKYILEYNKKCYMLKVKSENYRKNLINGKVAIVTAGASDIRYAEETYEILVEFCKNVYRYYDIGVSGIHRTLDTVKDIIEKDIDVVIVFAGFEGALPSILGGLLDTIIIAVPTSTGYGLGGKGLAALLSMLNSCSPNIAVVNINSGVRAALLTYIVLKRIYKD